MFARSRLAPVLTGVAVATTGAVAFWGWTLRPEKLAVWVLLSAALPAMWAYVEFAQVRGPDPATGRTLMTLHRTVIAWAGFTMSLKIACRLALAAELVDPATAMTGLRLGGVSMGLFLVYFGNTLPKLQSPWSMTSEPFDWQRVHRFVGWVCLVGGIATIALWLSLPLASAYTAGRIVMAAVAVLALGRKFFSLATYRPRRVSSGVP